MTRRRRSGALATSGSERRAARAPRGGHPLISAWAALVKPQPGHEPHLDGLRALASTLIVFYHCVMWVPALRDSHQEIPRGFVVIGLSCWFGVDIFFVLSGFLIGRILFRQLQRGSVSFKAFYVRRIFRVFPLYYLVLTVSVLFLSRIPMWHILYGNVGWLESLKRSWANYLYVSNYVYGMQHPNPLSWGWSLCIEEHFYLAIPFMMFMLFRLVKGLGRLVFLATLSFVPLICRWWEFANTPGMTDFYGIYPRTHTHGDGLVFGMLIAYVYVFHRRTTAAWVEKLGHATWILGLACFAAIVCWGGPGTPGTFSIVWQFFVLAAGSGLLVLNGLFLSNAVSRLLSSRVWVPLARTSYGQYLIHLFVVFWVRSWWPGGPHSPAMAVASTLAFFAVVLLVAFAMASALFLVVERPFLERGARLAREYLAVASDPIPPGKIKTEGA